MFGNRRGRRSRRDRRLQSEKYIPVDTGTDLATLIHCHKLQTIAAANSTSALVQVECGAHHCPKPVQSGGEEDSFNCVSFECGCVPQRFQRVRN